MSMEPEAGTPPAQMAEAAKDHPESPKTPGQQISTLAQAVTSSLMERLTAESKRKGGVLTIHDLYDLEEEFQHKAVALTAAFEKSFEEYVHARERAQWNLAREYPFDRLIVGTFADLFVSDKDALKSPDAVTRRILPGFFMALNIMVGHENIEAYQERCRQIVARVSAGREGEFAWDDVFHDAEARDLALDSQVVMALHFADMDKRVQWFVKMINDHLPPLAADADPAVAGWQVTEKGFRRLLRNLLSDVTEALATESGRLKLTKMRGAETCAQLADILGELRGRHT